MGNLELQGERSRAPRSRALRQGPLGPWTHSGEPAPGAEQTMSASLAYGAKRVPGQRKSKGQPENECIHFQGCPFDFRGASRRPTGKAGRPGTVVGVKTSWRKLSQQERRQTQVSLHSFLFLKKARIPFLFRGKPAFLS